MKATVTKRCYGAADNHPYPRWWHPGEEVTGQLAATLMEQGVATPLTQVAPENKALGGAPEVKTFPADRHGSESDESGPAKSPKAGKAKKPSKPGRK